MPDILVNSFYDPLLDEGCAFEELISFHGGLGGPQTRAFILHPVALPVPDEPIVGAAAVHGLLTGWRESLQGGALPRGGARRRGRDVSDTVVFIPAWNEEENLPAVLDDLRAELPDVDVLVVDDGSTDRTADVAREHGAEVLSLGTNRGLPVGIAAGYAWALEHGYAYCGRVDADGQHPAPELARLLALVRDDRCDVAVGSRFVSGDGYEPYRYKPDHVRRFGTAALRRAMGQRPRAAVRRRDERPLRRQREGAAAPRRAVHDRGARGRGADPHRRRGPAAGGGAGEHGRARERRVEAPRQQGAEGRAHRRRHARRGEARPARRSR